MYIMNIQDIFSGKVKADTVQSIDSLTILRSDSLMERTRQEEEFRKQYEESERYNLTAVDDNNAASGLIFYRPTPVSYTHLDVYKRQMFIHRHKILSMLYLNNITGFCRISRQNHCPIQCCQQTFIWISGNVPVSYTHLIPINTCCLKNMPTHLSWATYIYMIWITIPPRLPLVSNMTCLLYTSPSCCLRANACLHYEDSNDIPQADHFRVQSHHHRADR